MYPIVIDMPPEVRAVREVRASRNLLAALDKNQRLFVWSAVGPGNTLGLKEIPRAVPALKKHRLRHVYLGKTYIFAMGDNIGEPPRHPEARREYSNMLEKSGERRRHRESVFEKKRLLPKSVSIDSQLSLPDSNDENINLQNELVIISKQKKQEIARARAVTSKSCMVTRGRRNHFMLAPRQSDRHSACSSKEQTLAVIHSVEYPARFKRVPADRSMKSQTPVIQNNYGQIKYQTLS
jgi:hypothetical protein